MYDVLLGTIRSFRVKEECRSRNGNSHISFFFLRFQGNIVYATVRTVGTLFTFNIMNNLPLPKFGKKVLYFLYLPYMRYPISSIEE